MSELGISQMPLAENGGDAELKMVHEVDLLQSLVDGSCTADDPVAQAATMLEGQVKLEDSLTEVQRVFDQHNVAIVIDAESIIGVIKQDRCCRVSCRPTLRKI